MPLSKLLLRLSSDLERIIRVLEICRVEAVRLGLTLLHRKESKSRQAPTGACSTHTNTCTFCIAHALCRSSHTHHHCCSRHNGFRSSTEARRRLGAEEAALRTRCVRTLVCPRCQPRRSKIMLTSNLCIAQQKQHSCSSRADPSCRASHPRSASSKARRTNTSEYPAHSVHENAPC